MTPDQVTALGDQLKRAIAADDEAAGATAAVELLSGVANNLAVLAHPTGKP